MSKISVYIIAYNEAEKVAATIESARWADEIVLVDSWSTDGTPEIATRLGARVVQVEFKGFGDLRNQALAACTHDWIFSLDADERCTPEVEAEIRAITKTPTALDVYWVPRRNYFMGRWIRHSGWYPNYRQPQLFRNGRMRYDLKPVHEGYRASLRQAHWSPEKRHLAVSVQEHERGHAQGQSLLQPGRRKNQTQETFHGHGAVARQLGPL